MRGLAPGKLKSPGGHESLESPGEFASSLSSPFTVATLRFSCPAVPPPIACYGQCRSAARRLKYAAAMTLRVAPCSHTNTTVVFFCAAHDAAIRITAIDSMYLKRFMSAFCLKTCQIDESIRCAKVRLLGLAAR